MQTANVMKVKIKFSTAFDTFNPDSGSDPVILDLEAPVPVKTVLAGFNFPDDLPKLILINGRVKTDAQMLQDGDTVSIFPTMSGG